ncbi:MAG TPA: ribonuclease HI [Methanosarcina sp.]|nr:ribonuclease HI [Methanosarcina sp.]
MSNQPAVQLYTDGACRGNPGPGGWGCLMKYGDQQKEIYGGEESTTNNRMELTAAIEGLAALKKPSVVDLYTDSQYVRNGITGWIADWKERGWLTASKKPVKNKDLWEKLDVLVGLHTVRFHWVKGHAGHPENERADQLANIGLLWANEEES